jgi:glucose/arabinose dehydrogenase
MHAQRVFSLLGVILVLSAGLPAMAQTLDSSAGPLRITPVVTGLTEPWGMAFLPDGGLLVTERDGRLLRVQDGIAQPITGIPQVWAEGQGGLLDVMVPRDFTTSREVWLTFDAQTGALWLVEHGAMGGDEVNRIESGQNYGWPAISYGVNYDGANIGEGQAKDGMQQPLHYWDPSIAPSGLMVYRGDLFPAWQGDMFTGSLNSDFLARLDPEAGFAEERLAAPQTGRVRDVIEAPDGSIWFLSVIDGAVYRIDPAG